MALLQVDETCVMCNDCFISSDHDDHEVFFYYTQSGGCCDCGDTEAWAAEGFCTSHKVNCLVCLSTYNNLLVSNTYSTSWLFTTRGPKMPIRYACYRTAFW